MKQAKRMMKRIAKVADPDSEDELVPLKQEPRGRTKKRRIPDEFKSSDEESTPKPSSKNRSKSISEPSTSKVRQNHIPIPKFSKDRSKSKSESRPVKKNRDKEPQKISRQSKEGEKPSKAQISTPKRARSPDPESSSAKKRLKSSDPYDFDESSNDLPPKKTPARRMTIATEGVSTSKPTTFQSRKVPVPNASMDHDLPPTKIAKKTPARRMTISTEVLYKPTTTQSRKDPVPIIDAHQMKTRRSSVYNPEIAKPTPPKRRLSTSGAPQRRYSIDMFSKASEMLKNQNGSNFMQRRPSVSEESVKLREARNERLREVAAKAAKEKLLKTTQETRITAIPKVKVTTKNRGDFLTNLPDAQAAVKPQKLPQNTATTSNETEKQSGISQTYVKSMIESFRQHNVKHQVENDDSGNCSNLNFDNNELNNNVARRRRFSVEAPRVCFYNQIKFPVQDQQPSAIEPTMPKASNTDRRDSSGLASILKIETSSSTQKKRVRFPSTEKELRKIKFYEKDLSEYAPPPPEENNSRHQVSSSTSRVFPTVPILPLPTLNGQQPSTKFGVNKPAAASVSPRVMVVRPFQSLSSEDLVTGRLISWKPEWLRYSTSQVPESFTITQMKTSYSTLDEYKTIVEPIIELELLAKAANSFKSMQIVSSGKWDLMILERTSYDPRGRTQISLLTNDASVNSYKIGNLVLLKVQTPASTTEHEFFGYISSKFGKKVTIDTMCDRGLIEGVQVVKCFHIMYIRAELKSLIALKNLQPTTIVKKMLKPLENKLNVSKVFSDKEFSVTNLSDNQLEIVQKISSGMIDDAGIVVIQGL
jgi:hypothetical protein